MNSQGVSAVNYILKVLFHKFTDWALLIFSLYGSCPYGEAALKVQKRENFLGSDIEICTFSYLVMQKC